MVTSEGYHACKDSGRLGHKIQWCRTCTAPSSWAARCRGWSYSGPPGEERGHNEMSDPDSSWLTHVRELPTKKWYIRKDKINNILSTTFLLSCFCILPVTTCRMVPSGFFGSLDTIFSTCSSSPGPKCLQSLLWVMSFQFNHILGHSSPWGHWTLQLF